ncbi:FG-GAP-like repeat-containing protein [Bacteroides sp.]
MKNIFSLKKSVAALSLLMTCGASAQVAQVTFEQIMSSKGDDPTLPFTHRTRPAVGDFNNDDFMDIIMGGQNWNEYKEGENFGLGGWYSSAIVIKNNGNGMFEVSAKSKSEAGTDDNPDTPGTPVEGLANLPVSTYSFFRFLDFNNDGNLDLIIRGKGEHNFNVGEYLILLENLGPDHDYKFKMVEDHGLNQALNEDYPIGISIGDYNKDGFVDILLMGCENKDKGLTPEDENYDPDFVKRRFVELYKNNGGDGTFTLQKIAETQFEDFGGNFKPMSHGDIAFVDFDNDGWLDVFCTGYADNGEGSVRDGGREIRIYQNKGEDGFLDVTPFEDPYFLGGYDLTLFVEDLNGDGFMDIILLGNAAASPYGKAEIYYNNGDLTFTPLNIEESGFMSVRGVAAGTFADMNHDGKLDAALMGYVDGYDQGWFSGIICQGDDNTFTYEEKFNKGERDGGLVAVDLFNNGKLDAFGVDGSVSKEVALFKNTSNFENQAPTAPTNVVAKIEEGMLTVTWDDATDDVTPVTALFYNVYVKNNKTGKISMIIPANPETGRLKVITDYQTGVRSTLKEYTMFVDDSEDYDYTVGVQAIDQAQAASTFTTSSLSTGIARNEVANNIRIVSEKDGFIVKADSDLDVEVTDMLGRVIKKDKTNKLIPVSLNGIYLITVGGQTYKVVK